MARRPRGVPASRSYVFRREPLAEAIRASNKACFTHAELAELARMDTRERAPAAVRQLIEQGVLVRLAQGLYGHGSPNKPVPSPADIIQWRFGANSHLAFDSAMQAHGREGPISSGTVFVRGESSPKAFAVTDSLDAISLAMGSRWEHGVVRVQVDGLGEIWVSDTLCTALDGLQSPQHCGGILRVARFVAAHQASWSDAQLVEVARRAPQFCIQRLGYLVKLCGRDVPASLRLNKLERDRRALVLDANAPRVNGDADRLWRINVNVNRNQLAAALAGPGPVLP